MNFEPLRFVMSGSEISNKTIVQFYDTVAKLLGVDDPAIRYDCRRILISANIQDCIYEAYAIQNPKAFMEHPDDARCQVTMMMACSGPKVERSFPDNTVEVQDGFFVLESEECKQVLTSIKKEIL